MIDVLDTLADYLATDPHNQGTDDITWILGDPQMSSPTTLPFGYIIPFNDQVATGKGAGTNAGAGTDMHVITVPLLIVDDLHRYGDPAAVAGKSYFEQPGYRTLAAFSQSVIDALRKNITLGGVVATTTVAERRNVPLAIADKVYRACRMTVIARQRRGR